MEKATTLDGIDYALNKYEPVTPDHEFYTDFKGVRGDFQEKKVYRYLNVNTHGGKLTFDARVNGLNKTLLFLAGMRGAGKTSELAKYTQKLDNPDCFFVVTCNIDQELDMNDVQYMDILIFQLEKLLERADEAGLQLSDTILKKLNTWFDQRVQEINTSLKADAQAGLEVGGQGMTGTLLKKLLNISLTLKAGVSGSKERAEKIRTTFKNRFTDFALQFNEFIERVNNKLREQKMAQQVLFIIDGLEKTMSAETRRKIIMEESNRIQQVKVNTVFTLPIELTKEQARIRLFAEVVNFPCIKLIDRDNQFIPKAIEKFKEFVYRRVDPTLFDKEETVLKAIQFSGGVPRELLRILEEATLYMEDEDTTITETALDKAINHLSNEYARFITPEELDELKQIKADLDNDESTAFTPLMQEMLEKLIILEYNDGTYKRAHPLVAHSKLYQQRVNK